MCVQRYLRKMYEYHTDLFKTTVNMKSDKGMGWDINLNTLWHEECGEPGTKSGTKGWWKWKIEWSKTLNKYKIILKDMKHIIWDNATNFRNMKKMCVKLPLYKRPQWKKQNKQKLVKTNTKCIQKCPKMKSIWKV